MANGVKKSNISNFYLTKVRNLMFDKRYTEQTYILQNQSNVIKWIARVQMGSCSEIAGRDTIPESYSIVYICVKQHQTLPILRV